MAQKIGVKPGNLIKLGLLIQQAGLNAACDANRRLMYEAYQRIEDAAAKELASLRLATNDMSAAQATEMTILLAKAGA